MGRATLQGCHRGLEIIWISQRPVLVSADFRGKVAETYVFTLSVGHDLAAITEVYGREHHGPIRALQNHQYARFVGTAIKIVCNRNPGR